MASTSAAIDVRQIAEQKLEESKFPAAGPQAFRVYFAAETHAQAWKHARDHGAVEICGVLVGDWYRDADGPFLLASDLIRCDAAESKFAEVTFTHESWSHINREMDTRHRDKRIVGWYHSHPDFGIFLSDRDVFIHQHFFSNAGQIALVVDPIRGCEGVFVWRNGKPTLTPHYWVGNDIVTSASSKDEPPHAPSKESTAQPLVATGPQPSALDRPLVLLAMLLLATVGYLLGSLKSNAEMRMMAEGAVAHYGLWKGVRPGLEQELALAEANLEKSLASLEKLSTDHLKSAAPDADKAKLAQEEWGKVLADVGQTRRHLSLIEQTYGLTPEERSVLVQIYALKMAEVARAKNEAEATPPAKKSDDPARDAAPTNQNAKNGEPAGEKKADPGEVPAVEKPKKAEPLKPNDGGK